MNRSLSSWGPSTWVASGCILLWRIPRPSQDWGLLFLAWQCFQLRRTHAQTSSWQQANEGTDKCDFLPLKFSHYPTRPVPVPELFCKYPTRPVPKSKTSTRRTLVVFNYCFPHLWKLIEMTSSPKTSDKMTWSGHFESPQLIIPPIFAPRSSPMYLIIYIFYLDNKKQRAPNRNNMYQTTKWTSEFKHKVPHHTPSPSR